MSERTFPKERSAPNETPVDDAERRERETDHLLYPQVQEAMNDLKEITAERAEEDGIGYTEAGEPILSPEIIEAWAKKEHYGNRVRGTFNNGETYVYVKYCNFVEKKEEVDEALATARDLTGRGALHPESQWAVFASPEGYQLIVVAPKLEAWSLSDELDGNYNDRPSRPHRDNSHLNEWFQRIDPDFVPGQPIPEDSPLHHLNWHEASHPDNWGWDKTGTLFPVDVEVLRPGKVTHKNYEPWKPHVSSSSVDDYLFDL